MQNIVCPESVLHHGVCLSVCCQHSRSRQTGGRSPVKSDVLCIDARLLVQPPECTLTVARANVRAYTCVPAAVMLVLNAAVRLGVPDMQQRLQTKPYTCYCACCKHVHPGELT